MKRFSPTPRYLSVVLAEFLGTALLAFAMASASLQYVYAEGQSQPANQYLSIFAPFAIGGVFAIVIYIFRSYTSADFNPAITLAHLVRGEQSILRAVAAVAAQVLGSFAGVFVVSRIFAGDKFDYSDFPKLLEGLSTLGLTNTSVAVLEAIGAFMLVLAVLAVRRSAALRNVAPLLSGVALALAIFFTQPFTFGVINPSISAALGLPVIYWIAPLLGGVVAAVVFYLLDMLNTDEKLTLNVPRLPRPNVSLPRRSAPAEKKVEVKKEAKKDKKKKRK